MARSPRAGSARAMQANSSTVTASSQSRWQDCQSSPTCYGLNGRRSRASCISPFERSTTDMAARGRGTPIRTGCRASTRTRESTGTHQPLFAPNVNKLTKQPSLAGSNSACRRGTCRLERRQVTVLRASARALRRAHRIALRSKVGRPRRPVHYEQIAPRRS